MAAKDKLLLGYETKTTYGDPAFLKPRIKVIKFSSIAIDLDSSRETFSSIAIEN